MAWLRDNWLRENFPKARHYYFWFMDDAIEIKALHKALEKKNVDDATAAWASQTGKGLLFMARRREDKATPFGVFNLVRNK